MCRAPTSIGARNLSTPPAKCGNCRRMSTAHSHDHAVAAHGADAHHFDGEPAGELPADEPPTPIWVPILGLVLFVLAGTAFLAGAAADAPATAPAQGTEKEAAARPAPTPPAQRPDAQALPAGLQQIQPLQRGVPAIASGSVPAANLRKLTPEEEAAMRKRLLEARSKAGAPAQPAQPK